MTSFKKYGQHGSSHSIIIVLAILGVFIVGYLLLNATEPSIIGSVIKIPTAGQNIVAKVAQLTDCAQHFVRVSASNLQNSCTSSNYIEPYGCKRNMKLPKNACPKGLKSGAVFSFGDAFNNAPSYQCYVPQKKGATSSPAGCPINYDSMTCASGFKLDTPAAGSWWGGPDSNRACYITCTASDSRNANVNWPCMKEGYKAYLTNTHGNYDRVCCAKGKR